VAQIAASILEFGFVAPVLVDERGEIIAGQGRAIPRTRASASAAHGSPDPHSP
jgi:hypothetical protein